MKIHFKKGTYKLLTGVLFFSLLLMGGRIVLATSETAQDKAVLSVASYLDSHPDKEVALRLLAALQAAQNGGSMIGAYISSPT